MSSLIGAHILISRILRVPAGIAHNRVNHSRDALETRLHSPETSRSKCSNLSHRILPFLHSFSRTYYMPMVSFDSPSRLRCLPSSWRRPALQFVVVQRSIPAIHARPLRL